MKVILIEIDGYGERPPQRKAVAKVAGTKLTKFVIKEILLDAKNGVVDTDNPDMIDFVNETVEENTLISGDGLTATMDLEEASWILVVA